MFPGAGGLGNMAVQIAKANTKQKVMVIDVNQDKLDYSISLGADYGVCSTVFA
jgi:D-arabinose 1-dehydrogenase-like Zn-dependent alcohol dehydrogenase